MGTNPNYWDCDCEANYIHAKACPACPLCGTLREEGPDAHINEVGAPENMAPAYSSIFDLIEALEVAYAELENHTGVPGVKDNVIPCILSALEKVNGGEA